MSTVLSHAQQLLTAYTIASAFDVRVWSVHTDDPTRGVVRMVLLPEKAWRDVVSPHPVHVHREGPNLRLFCQPHSAAVAVEVMGVKPEDIAGIDLYEHGKPVRLVTTQSWALVPREAE